MIFIINSYSLYHTKSNERAEVIELDNNDLWVAIKSKEWRGGRLGR
jgi:hypothetical protein